MLRTEFEQLAKDVLLRTLDCCRGALSDADLVASDIDEVVLVGGSTRIPAVSQYGDGHVAAIA